MLGDVEDIDREHATTLTFFWPSVRANRRGTAKPDPSTVIVTRGLNLEYLRHAPAAHRQRLASVTYGLMGRFAVVADEGVVLYTHCREAVLGFCSAVGTDAVRVCPRELLYCLLGRQRHCGLNEELCQLCRYDHSRLVLVWVVLLWYYAQRNMGQ